MTEPTSALKEPVTASRNENASYAPYGQLVKMLIPSSGCVALYDAAGELIWCSDGYEPPDFRELVESLKVETNNAVLDGQIRQTANEITAYSAALRGEGGLALGFVIIHLGKGRNAAKATSMTSSLLRPVLDVLASRIGLEHSAKTESSAADDLPLLLAVDEAAEGSGALDKLVTHCVENLNCVSGAFLVPERNISVIKSRGNAESVDAAQMLERTQKHLLAWAQLNNRPMVVNRVGTEAGAAPFKILSCPVRDPNGGGGLMALFRAGDAPNFEIRDVRILEFISRKAVGILNSQHDTLTGLANPVVFARRVREALASEAKDGRPLLYIGIDRLEVINDAFGFDAGDEVIHRLAELIRSRLSGADFACRIGGDRFAVLMPAATLDAAREVANGLIGAMANLGYMKGSDAVPVAVSVGIATSGPGRRDFAHLLAAAEVACKRARTAGGSRLELYVGNESLSPERESELMAAASLKQALQTGELRLQAQPIVDLYHEPSGVLGYEVLVRMRDASGELVSPDKFVPAADRYGLMGALDRWVVAAAVRAMQGAKKQVSQLPLGVALNVSAQSLAAPDFPAFVLAEIKAAGLPPELFCFELKEKDAVNRIEDTERFIAALTDAGCHVSLDDFGTGLSSLAHLKRLKVSYLKIDGSLIRRVLDDIHAESLVRGLAKAAQTLGVLTVAEHVESDAIAKKLRQLEVDLAQGYFFGHPAPLSRALGTAEPAGDTVANSA
ncbi:MAG TPA: EAL domain-containing protein [Gammaproteobacteria bacterium]|jgi:diguanylate cyclase (GGDEF)-like protein